MNNINKTNWLVPPNNRWSFKNMSSLFRTVKLSKSHDPYIIPQNLTNLESFEFDGLEGKVTIREMLDSSYTDAFVVLKDNNIIFEEYQNGMREDDLHLMNSVSKSFVGMLIGILEEKQKLNSKDKLKKYIPELQDSAFRETSIQHALDMTAAVKFSENYLDPSSDFWHEAAVVNWRQDLREENSPKTLLEFMANLKETSQKEFEIFNYRTVLTNILALTVERSCETKFQNLLQTYIWDKLKAEYESHIVSDETDFPYMGAGMNASARDLAKFGLMLMNNGTFNNEQIVPKNWIKSTLEGSIEHKDIFSKSEYGLRLPGFHYKNQIWVGNPETMICIGIYGQAIYVDQKNKVVIVKLSSHPEPDNALLLGNTFLGIAALSENI